jgi:hypothetical protein
VYLAGIGTVRINTFRVHQRNKNPEHHQRCNAQVLLRQVRVAKEKPQIPVEGVTSISDNFTHKKRRDIKIESESQPLQILNHPQYCCVLSVKISKLSAMLPPAEKANQIVFSRKNYFHNSIHGKRKINKLENRCGLF